MFVYHCTPWCYPYSAFNSIQALLNLALFIYKTDKLIVVTVQVSAAQVKLSAGERRSGFNLTVYSFAYSASIAPQTMRDMGSESFILIDYCSVGGRL